MLVRFFLICAILTIASTAYSHNKIGNGGAGMISHSGEYILLTSIQNESKYSGVNTEVENCSSTIFNDIKNDIRKMQTFLSREVGVFLMNNACRGIFYRKFDPFENSLTSPMHKIRIKHFKNVYSLATGVDKKKIVIYAITLPNNKKTYFMPDFYKLTFMKQKIILFHEIFWLYFHSQDTVELELFEEVHLYQNMLALEQALIEYLIDTGNIKNQTKFANALYEFKSLNRKYKRNSFLSQ